MIDWTFYIDDVEYDEPLGFADIVIRAKRDDNWHGIFFEASTSDLTFYGEAAAYLVHIKETQGFAADVTFKAVANCGQDNDILTGRLDFRKYKKSCGNECLVTVPVEMEGCTMTLRNRYDQKVDLSNNLAFNGTTVLPSYNGLNFNMDLPAQAVLAGAIGSVDSAGQTIDLEIFPDATQEFAVRPTYQNQELANINETQLVPTIFAASNNGLNDSALSPIILLDGNIDCFAGEFNYSGRVKGSISFYFEGLAGSGVLDIQIVVSLGNDVPYGPGETVLTSDTVFSGAVVDGLFTDTFDFSFSGSTPINQGEAFNVYLKIDLGPNSFLIEGDRTVVFDPETAIDIQALQSCPTTEATVSLIHETASRITEAITDRCLTVKSDYYGRTDSEPYAAAADGCGSLRVLSSGLRIRQADNPTHFMSLKDLFEGLNPIDNIGMGIEDDKLRIEPVEYFYQNTEIIRMPFIPKANEAMDDTEAYSIIKVGYKKWETEGINGLDEFNSNKEFRTSLKNISNPLDITSPFIAGGYPIELTRQQSFASSGGADTKYDNDNFIICVVRQGYAYGGYAVEQGNIDNAANFYSPATAYNWRIRPFYNLMRWWKSIAQSYANLVNTTSKFIFSAGTGNLEAEGELSAGDACKLEAGVKAENDDLLRADFATLPTPIWKPETVQFIYPMSVKDFNLIKANPYGYVFYQCGQGDFAKGFITNLLYKPAKGEADITLKLKWD